MVIIQGREDGAAHMGAHQVMRDSCESRLNLRTVLADAVGIGHKGKNSVKKNSSVFKFMEEKGAI